MMEGEMGIFKPMFKPIFDFSSYIPPKFGSTSIRASRPNCHLRIEIWRDRFQLVRSRIV